MATPRSRRLPTLLVALALLLPAAGSTQDDLARGEERYRQATALIARKQLAEAAPALEKFLAEFPKHPRAPDARLRLGETLLALERPEPAARTFATIAEDGSLPPPLRAEGFLGLARARLASKQDPEAIAALSRAFDLTEYDERLGPPVALLLAEVLARLGRHEEAAAAYRRVTRWPFHPDAPRAYFLMAESYRQAGRLLDAAVAYRNTAENHWRSPFAPRAALAAGDSFLALGRLEDAEAEYQRVLRDYPASEFAPRAQLGLARSALARGDHAVARSAYRAAATLFPNSGVAPEAELRIADILLAEGKTEQARAGYAALTDSPDRAVAREAQYSLSRLLLGEGRKPEAVALLRRLAEDRAAARWSQLARIRLAEVETDRDVDARLRSLQEVLDEKPEAGIRAEASRLRETLATLRRTEETQLVAKLLEEAAQHARAGRWADARRVYARLRERAPDPPLRETVLAGLAEACARLQDNAAAQSALRELQAGSPSPASLALVRLRLARAYQSWNPDEALAAYRAAAQEGADRATRSRALLGLGRLLSSLGRHAEAEAALRGLLEKDPDPSTVPEAIYALAWTLLDRGRTEDAERTFARLIAEHPQHPLALDAGFRLGERAFAAGRDREAAERFRPAAASGVPAAAAAGYRLGWSLHRLGSHAEAAVAFAGAARQARDDLAVECRVRAAECWLEAERPAEALALIGSLLTTDPPIAPEARKLWLEARLAAARARLLQGEPERARETAAPIALPAYGRHGAQAQLLVAQAALRQSGPRAALPEFLKAESAFGRYREVAAEAAFRAGECYEKLRNPAAARAVWQRVAGLFPETPWADRSRARLSSGRSPSSRPQAGGPQEGGSGS